MQNIWRCRSLGGELAQPLCKSVTNAAPKDLTYPPETMQQICKGDFFKKKKKNLACKTKNNICSSDTLGIYFCRPITKLTEEKL